MATQVPSTAKAVSARASVRDITRDAWLIIGLCAFAVAFIVGALATVGDRADNYALTVLAVSAVGFTVCGLFVAMTETTDALRNRSITATIRAWSKHYTETHNAYLEAVSDYARVKNERDHALARLASNGDYTETLRARLNAELVARANDTENIATVVASLLDYSDGLESLRATVADNHWHYGRGDESTYGDASEIPSQSLAETFLLHGEILRKRK